MPDLQAEARQPPRFYIEKLARLFELTDSYGIFHTELANGIYKAWRNVHCDKLLSDLSDKLSTRKLTTKWAQTIKKSNQFAKPHDTIFKRLEFLNSKRTYFHDKYIPNISSTLSKSQIGLNTSISNISKISSLNSSLNVSFISPLKFNHELNDTPTLNMTSKSILKSRVKDKDKNNQISPPKNAAIPASTRLYNDAKERSFRRSSSELRAAANLPSYSFKPELVARNYTRGGRDEGLEVGKKLGGDGHNRSFSSEMPIFLTGSTSPSPSVFNSLYARSQEKLKQRRLKEELAKNPPRECTFSPDITLSQSTTPITPERSNTTVFERLSLSQKEYEKEFGNLANSENNVNLLSFLIPRVSYTEARVGRRSVSPTPLPFAIALSASKLQQRNTQSVQKDRNRNKNSVYDILHTNDIHTYQLIILLPAIYSQRTKP